MTLNKAAPLRPPSFHTGSSFHLPPLLPDPSPNASSSIPPMRTCGCARAQTTETGDAVYVDVSKKFGDESGIILAPAPAG